MNSSPRRLLLAALPLLLVTAAWAQQAPPAGPAPAPPPAPASTPPTAPAPPVAPAPAATTSKAADEKSKPAGKPVTKDGAAVPLPGIGVQLNQPKTNAENYSALQVMMLLTAIVVAPTMMLMLTCFTRIIIVLSFLRQALGTQQVPPNQIMLGLALFMTIFIMAPSFRQIQAQAIEPYLAEKINTEQAIDAAFSPLKAFMIRNTRPNDLMLFLEMARERQPNGAQDCPGYVLIPAFCLSELKTGFEIGFLIYLPFLVIDVVVASTVMSMGMMMLPPVVLSLPFKLLLFVLVDGWHLILRGLAQSFG